MMKKIIVALIIGVLLGGVGGFVSGLFAFPFLFPPPPVNEVVSDKSDDDILARASFIHANPADSVHYGKGDATLYRDLVHLKANFEVGPGPKYHVYLVPDADITPDSAVQNMMFVDLGRLKAFSGSQNYPIPNGVDLKRFQSVVIWCEQFNVLISPAVINLAR